MNITLVQAEYKPFETIFCPLSPEEFENHMVLHYRDITVECPVQMDSKKPVGIILPTFKLPYRKYPVFFYLYAIAMYLSGKSMRTAARETAERFGVPKFSHSTISRALNVLTLKIDELITLCPPRAKADAQHRLPYPVSLR